MVTVILLGELGKTYGRRHRLAITSAAEAIRALVANFPSLERELVVSGERGVGYVPGFSSVENEISVGVEIKASQPVVRSITDADVDAVRVKVSVPQLTNQNTTNGDLNGSQVSFAIDRQTNGGGFIEVIKDTISGKTTTKYQRSYYVPLTGSAPWEIRIRRITADSTSTAIQNKTFLESYTEVIESVLNNSVFMQRLPLLAQALDIFRRSAS